VHPVDCLLLADVFWEAAADVASGKASGRGEGARSCYRFGLTVGAVAASLGLQMHSSMGVFFGQRLFMHSCCAISVCLVERAWSFTCFPEACSVA